MVTDLILFYVRLCDWSARLCFWWHALARTNQTFWLTAYRPSRANWPMSDFGTDCIQTQENWPMSDFGTDCIQTQGNWPMSDFGTDCIQTQENWPMSRLWDWQHTDPGELTHVRLWDWQRTDPKELTHVRLWDWLHTDPEELTGHCQTLGLTAYRPRITNQPPSDFGTDCIQTQNN